MILPIVIGGTVCVGIYALGWLADWSALKRLGVAAGSLILSYKGPDIYVQNLINKRSDAIRKGLPDAIAMLVICAEAGPTVNPAFNHVPADLGPTCPQLG